MSRAWRFAAAWSVVHLPGAAKRYLAAQGILCHFKRIVVCNA
jgi:hypothetical protein